MYAIRSYYGILNLQELVIGIMVVIHQLLLQDTQHKELKELRDAQKANKDDLIEYEYKYTSYNFV